MHFYRTKEDGSIVCAQCAGRTSLPPDYDKARDSAEAELGPRDHLEYIGVTGVPEGIFRCASCEELFLVYDGHVFMEVQ